MASKDVGGGGMAVSHHRDGRDNRDLTGLVAAVSAVTDCFATPDFRNFKLPEVPRFAVAQAWPSF